MKPTEEDLELIRRMIQGRAPGAQLFSREKEALRVLLADWEERKKDSERLRAFAQEAVNALPEFGLDGGELQDLAVKHRLLKPEERTEPCCEEACICAEYGFPTTCYRKTELLKGDVMQKGTKP